MAMLNNQMVIIMEYYRYIYHKPKSSWSQGLTNFAMNRTTLYKAILNEILVILVDITMAQTI